MIDESSFRRGDVILVPMPLVTDSAQRKARPAVVIQNDVGNRFSPNLIVASISGQLPSREYPTNFIVREDSADIVGTGLNRSSVVQAEIITTIPKRRVIQRLGRFNDGAMRTIDRCVKISLGLA